MRDLVNPRSVFFGLIVLYGFDFYIASIFDISLEHILVALVPFLLLVSLLFFRIQAHVLRYVIFLYAVGCLFLLFLAGLVSSYVLAGLCLTASCLIFRFSFSSRFYKIILFLTFVSLFVEFFFFNLDLRRLNIDGFGLYRPAGIFLGPNASATALVLCLACLVYRNDCSGFYFAIAIFGVLISGSRTPILALLVLVPWYMGWRAALLIMVAGLLFFVYGGFEIRAFDTKTLSVSFWARFNDLTNILLVGTDSGAPADLGVFSLVDISLAFTPLVVLFVIICFRCGLIGWVFLFCSFSTNLVYVIPLNVLFMSGVYTLLERKEISSHAR